MLPLFCAVLFGTIDYGWYFYQRFTLAAAVRDGIRLGVTINQNATPDPPTTAIARASADLTAANMTVVAGTTFTTTTQGTSPSKTMTLSGVYTFVPLVHFVPLPTTPMHYSMTMMFEQQL